MMSQKRMAAMEIAIRKVKENHDEAFRQARSSFIQALKQQEGVEKDWEFQSFFTMPGEDDTDVFVGITRYRSMDDVAKISENLMGSDVANNFFATFDMKAFVLLKAADGRPFNLEEVVTSGEQVLEVAVRRPKEGMEEKFQPLREAFFEQASNQPGYMMDKEFIDLQTGVKVVLIAWKSKADFQNALAVLSKKKEMADFFDAIDVQAYQALQLSTN